MSSSNHGSGRKDTEARVAEDDIGLRPIHHPRRMRIICIGAGTAGLCFAYKLQRSFEDYDFTIYEKNKDIAGVWFENRYPG